MRDKIILLQYLDLGACIFVVSVNVSYNNEYDAGQVNLLTEPEDHFTWPQFYILPSCKATSLSFPSASELPLERQVPEPFLL